MREREFLIVSQSLGTVLKNYKRNVYPSHFVYELIVRTYMRKSCKDLVFQPSNSHVLENTVANSEAGIPSSSKYHRFQSCEFDALS